MNIKNKKDSTSEIMGSMILLVIAITIFSVVYVTLLSEAPINENTLVTITGTLEGNNIIITHKGGYPLTMETVVVIKISGNQMNFTAEQLLDTESKTDGYWGVGERLVYGQNDLNSKNVEVTVVEPFNQDTIFVGILNNK